VRHRHPCVTDAAPKSAPGAQEGQGAGPVEPPRLLPSVEERLKVVPTLRRDETLVRLDWLPFLVAQDLPALRLRVHGSDGESGEPRVPKDASHDGRGPLVVGGIARPVFPASPGSLSTGLRRFLVEAPERSPCTLLRQCVGNGVLL